jgi:hypothetical protein
MELWNMTKLLPHCYAQVSRCDRLAVGDEHGFTGRCLRIQQIPHGENMGVCYIIYVDKVL